jgi:hypothetical protein
MKKILGFALLATLVSAPAFAGETYVKNEHTWSDSVTKTDLNLDSYTDSTRTEGYSAYADKIYIDGKIDVKGERGGDCNGGSECVSKDPKGGSQKVSFDDFTIHKAGSTLGGSYTENNWTHIDGTIKTKTNAYTDGHETSAGVR